MNFFAAVQRILRGQRRRADEPQATHTGLRTLEELAATEPTGVLFVHGIGEQAASATVRDFGDVILRWLRGWYVARALAPPGVVWAALSYDAKLRGPARFAVRLPPAASTLESTWLLAESHWAGRFAPPGLASMVGWAWDGSWQVLGRMAGEAWLRACRIWRRLLQQVTGRKMAPCDPLDLDQGRSDPGTVAAAFELLSTALLGLLYTFLALPVIWAVLAVLLVASLLPLPKLREFVLVRMAETFLVKSVGDFRTIATDDVQAAHVRQRIADDIEWLATKGRCQAIVVIAHSQGAVVALDALTSPGLPYVDRVTKLITFGGALNNFWRLYPERLNRPLPNHIHWLDVWSFYDPVAAAQLQTPCAVVGPSQAIQTEMRWFEEHVHPRSATPGAPPTAPLPRQVTNYSNVLTDHDTYWENPEQFVSRLAAEVDRPREYYQKSRFHHCKAVEQSCRRRLRVGALVSWRMYAMLAFLLVLLSTTLAASPNSLRDRGAAVGAWVARVPGADVLGGPGALFDGVRQALVAMAESTPVDGVAVVLSGLAAVLGHACWPVARDWVIGALVLGLLYALLHVGLMHALFRPWNAREASASLHADLAPRADWAPYWRGAVVLLALGELTGALVAWRPAP